MHSIGEIRNQGGNFPYKIQPSLCLHKAHFQFLPEAASPQFANCYQKGLPFFFPAPFEFVNSCFWFLTEGIYSNNNRLFPNMCPIILNSFFFRAYIGPGVYSQGQLPRVRKSSRRTEAANHAANGSNSLLVLAIPRVSYFKYSLLCKAGFAGVLPAPSLVQ